MSLKVILTVKRVFKYFLRHKLALKSGVRVTYLHTTRSAAGKSVLEVQPQRAAGTPCDKLRGIGKSRSRDT
jgi:hypothetical protein